MRPRLLLFLLVLCSAGCRPAGSRGPQAPPTLNLVARDFTFDGPDSVPAGLTTLRLANLGRYNHQALLFRVPSGHSAADVREALRSGQDPGWAILAAGGPGPTGPGDTSNATLLLEPGAYTLICFFIGGGPPHFLLGMVKDLHVTGPAPAGVDEPAPDLTVRLQDYRFALSRPLRQGHTRLRIENHGPQDHEFMIFRLPASSDSVALEDWLQGRREGAPPMEAVGGFSGLPNGSHGSTELVLEEGTYLLVCDVPDASDGRPHRTHGMWQVVHID
jgi:hypothetical protein